MIILDAFLRFSGVGLMLFMSVLLLKHTKESRIAFYLLLVNISVSSHFLGFTPEIFNLPYQFQLAFRFLDIFQIVFIWFLASSLFEKNFKLRGFHYAAAFIYSISVLMERLVQFDFIGSLPGWWAWLLNGMTLIIVAHMIKTALNERGDDLIEARRKSRLYFAVMIAFSAISVTVFGSILFSEHQATIDVICIWPAIVWGGYWICNVQAKVFDFDKTKTAPISSLNSQDLDLQKRLSIEVLENKCFLENDLSIESLAKKLGVSSYRLRSFINKTLGHTNFSTYINSFRIEEIKQAFASPENDHIPILTIALNHGFNSLSPFNRAFKQVEGITPKEFRKNLMV